MLKHKTSTYQLDFEIFRERVHFIQTRASEFCHGDSVVWSVGWYTTNGHVAVSNGLDLEYAS
jgi:predicted thioredoxin/glutaredoxin